MLCNSISLFVIPLALVFTAKADEPKQTDNATKDSGRWQSHAEYQAALRRTLLEEGDQKTVERIDAAVIQLMKAKKWKELWELTQNGNDNQSNASWYAVATIGALGSKAKDILPFMTKSLVGMSPNREENWPLSRAPYVGYYAHDVYSSIGRPSLPYLIPQMAPTLRVRTRTEGVVDLTERSWRERASDEIYILYDVNNSLAAHTVKVILDKKPFVFSPVKKLIDPNTPFVNRLLFNTYDAKETGRAMFRRLMKDKNAYICLQSAYVALQDPLLWEDAVKCLAGLVGDVWAAIEANRK